jgi:hypothetical protein
VYRLVHEYSVPAVILPHVWDCIRIAGNALTAISPPRAVLYDILLEAGGDRGTVAGSVRYKGTVAGSVRYKGTVAGSVRYKGTVAGSVRHKRSQWKRKKNATRVDGIPI